MNAQVRLYDSLFTEDNPNDAGAGSDFISNLNPDSLKVLEECKLEPSLADARGGQRVQFERLGYFCVDSEDSSPGRLVFNRTVTLRDTWAKIRNSRKKATRKRRRGRR